jgi:hypothetical protein
MSSTHSLTNIFAKVKLGLSEKYDSDNPSITIRYKVTKYSKLLINKEKKQYVNVAPGDTVIVEWKYPKGQKQVEEMSIHTKYGECLFETSDFMNDERLDLKIHKLQKWLHTNAEITNNKFLGAIFDSTPSNDKEQKDENGD